MESGKEERFIKACEDYADALFRYSLYKTSDRELAKDLVQECFTRTWNYLAAGQEVENLRAFFYRTLGNLVIDEYRKKKSISLDRMLEGGYDIKTEELEQLENKLDGERAITLLKKLSRPYADVVYLKYVENLSNQEIAQVLGESETAVAVKLHRGLKKMKKLFE